MNAILGGLRQEREARNLASYPPANKKTTDDDEDGAKNKKKRKTTPKSNNILYFYDHNSDQKYGAFSQFYKPCSFVDKEGVKYCCAEQFMVRY